MDNISMHDRDSFFPSNEPNSIDPAADQWLSPLENLLNAEPSMPPQGLGAAHLQHLDPMIGTPMQDSAMFPGQQSYQDTCAIRCQEFILEQFTGMPCDETALVQEAMACGWYTPGGGTQPQDVGNLLEQHGIAVNRYDNATIFHLANELVQGHKVIVGVDSGELWNDHPILEAINDALGIDGADHAVVVSGIDTSHPDGVHVIVSDPGTGEAVASYPLEQFLDAWCDSDFFMVATQDPAPSYLPEMVHFDYDLGHLPTIVGMPYEQFLTFEDHPEAWDVLVDAPMEVTPHGGDDPNTGGDDVAVPTDLSPILLDFSEDNTFTDGDDVEAQTDLFSPDLFHFATDVYSAVEGLETYDNFGSDLSDLDPGIGDDDAFLS